jgi:hypothetical protein
MPQSSELAGGEGFSFEGEVAAFYLVALLAQAYAPGIDDRVVVRVSVQQRDFGEPLDDVIVDALDVSGHPTRLSLQVKRSLTISSSATNDDFRSIIRDSWATLGKDTFRANTDRYGAAVGTIASAKDRALKTLCDWARESVTAYHFEARFAPGGNASAVAREVRSVIKDLLDEAKGASCTSEDMHQFLAHFVIIQFDLLREGATDPSEAINRLRDCLDPAEADNAPLVWSRLVQLARASAGKAGQFDRMRLVHSLSSVARLRAARRFQDDLDKLSELAKGYASLIQDDVGGTKLNRTSMLDQINRKLLTSRFVQIRGLPGSGKSVLVRLAVQRALERGPVLFLKAEQLEGTSWIAYANAHGLSRTPLQELLVEIAAVGVPTLFIDAIDRIEKQHQPVVLDVLRTIVESPLLEQWRVVASLRDSGIEVLRNWLGTFLDVLSIESLEVVRLDDEEAEELSVQKPHLRALLFGAGPVREIVRRPFFAKVLNQSYVANPLSSSFTPQSEVDLIENWWRKGGYDASGRSALERQRTLLNLARLHAQQLSQPIRLSQLQSVEQVDGLRSDGILQNAREGISVRFSHDIFFEWAFFQVLADRGLEWVEEIRACGEPPAIARVVELVAQWEYAHGRDWTTCLSHAEGSDLRSQWLRAWLVGPFGAVKFNADSKQFADAVFADDFRLFRKALVWFQAEKTTPNPNILGGTLPLEHRQRIADLLGWPSDVNAWRRLIYFVLRNIEQVPPRLFPEIVSVFEVWQNAFGAIANQTSRDLLRQCARWLTQIDLVQRSRANTEGSAFWAKVGDLDEFHNALAKLILRSSSAEPDFASDYVQRVIKAEHVRDGTFRNIVAYSPVLAQALPELLVDLSLKYLREELPDGKADREEQEFRAAAERRKAALAKPENERTRQDQISISSSFLHRFPSDYSHRDWDDLAIRNDHRSFSPVSPLRQPFPALFESAPGAALRLLRDLCNHAVTAWRQLQHRAPEGGRTPVPLDLVFPWGIQRFWGTEREYLWCRSTWAPDAIGAGFMALEEFCFAQMSHGRSADELIEQILEGNECIAILGIASMIALESKTVSDTTIPLFTSQRLLTADHRRMIEDLSSIPRLMGFHRPTDLEHVEAIKNSGERSVRKTQLRMMLPHFVFSRKEISDQVRDAILAFKEHLPFEFEESRSDPDIREELLAEALEFAELVDVNNYQAYRVKDNDDQVALVHVSPSAASPHKVKEAEEATRHLKQTSLWQWVSKSFENGALGDSYSVQRAIELAKEVDDTELFEISQAAAKAEDQGMRRGAVAGTAAIVLNFRAEAEEADLVWARQVLKRASAMPEVRGAWWSPVSVIPWHQAIFVARGLAADLREKTATTASAGELLQLATHPLEAVSLVAVNEACKLWDTDSKLTWAVLLLSLSLCHEPRLPLHQEPNREDIETLRAQRLKTGIDMAMDFYTASGEWSALPLPPPAWIKAQKSNKLRRGHAARAIELESSENEEEWGEPAVFWHSKRASEILECVPIEKVIGSEQKGMLLDFLASSLGWTIQKNSPPWVKRGRRDGSVPKTYEWTHILGRVLGRVAGLVPFADFHDRFLELICKLDDENCWAMLSPLASSLVCVYILDASVIPPSVLPALDICVDRLLQDATFVRENYRSGVLSGFDQPKLADTLMFISVEKANLAARYANGNWSEIGIILPVVDRLVRAAGWAASMMERFLTLCERSKTCYPVDVYADQVLAVIGAGPDKLKGWQGTFITARIAELVQFFVHRDAPMKLATAQKLLRILDMLVDMGDRRSAALQLSEEFREVRLSS